MGTSLNPLTEAPRCREKHWPIPEGTRASGPAAKGLSLSLSLSLALCLNFGGLGVCEFRGLGGYNWGT